MSLLIFILFVGIFNQYSNGNPEDVKFPFNDIPPRVKSVVCEGRNSSCSNNETCCQLESGQYGCCPLAGAVCCGDQLHCCPEGYVCDLERSSCRKESKESSGAVCPGGEMICAAGETCYQLYSGDYGCCPLPDALLCKDYIHCCPTKYACNNEKNQCEKGVLIPWFPNRKATPLDFPSKLIQDTKSVCPEKSTSCELQNGTYGSCPSPQASCCADKIHCCEKGYSCDNSGSKCLPDLRLTPLSVFEELVCPDGVTQCLASSTCCPNENNGKTTYSCCPYARGVCCGSNGLCCPHRYKCTEEHLNGTVNGSESSDLVCVFDFSEPPPPGSYACSGSKILCSTGSCCLPGHCNPVGGCL